MKNNILEIALSGSNKKATEFIFDKFIWPAERNSRTPATNIEGFSISRSFKLGTNLNPTKFIYKKNECENDFKAVLVFKLLH